MPTPAATTPPAEAGFDPLVFWIQHKSKVLLLAALFVVALGAYGISEYVRDKAQWPRPRRRSPPPNPRMNFAS